MLYVDNDRNVMFISEAGTEQAFGFGGVVGQEPPADQPTWHRSCEGGACIEAAATGENVILRSSVAPEAILTFTRSEWQEFLAGAKLGQFDGV